jgi:glycosyltransferase involved in cell wall biosynthesis
MINFSIIIPTYNRPHLIRRAIESALLNIKSGDEILVIDDGSTKDYVQIISRYDDEFVKYHKIKNGGVSVARNYGLDIAKNKYIAFLDDDDEWLEFHLDCIRETYAECSDIVGIFCDFNNNPNHSNEIVHGVLSWSRGKAKITELLKLKRMGKFDIYIGQHYKNQLSTDYIFPSSFSFNRHVCGDMNRFKIGLKRNQTWLFNSHICMYGKVAYIDKVTCMQHADAENRATGISTFDTILSRLEVMNDEWGNNKEFIEKNSILYKKIQFEDFFHAFKTCLRFLSVSDSLQLIKVVGFKNAFPYIFKSMLFIVLKKQVETRIT